MHDSVRFAFLAALAVSHPLASTAHTQRANERLVPISSEDLLRLAPRLDLALIAPTARKLHVEPKQSFSLLPADKAGRIDLVAVDYEQPQDPQAVVSTLGCGVFLVPLTGVIQFFGPLTGADELPIGCWDIAAVRLHRVPGGKSFFEFTGDLRTGQRAWQQPFTVRWDPQSSRYTMDTVHFD